VRQGASLEALLDRIEAPDPRFAVAAQARLDRLTKPRGSLGRLEELALRVVLVTGRLEPRIETPVIFTLAGDHGVVAEGVSAYPQAVTAQMVENFCRGGAAVNVLARHAGARVVVADLGVVAELTQHPGLVRVKVAPGTRNLARGPAMTREEARAAIEVGARLVEEAAPDCVGTGEMGIGNTTAASALTAALTGADSGAVTGRGTGLDETGWARKVHVAGGRSRPTGRIRATRWPCWRWSAAWRSRGWSASSSVAPPGAYRWSWTASSRPRRRWSRCASGRRRVST
jgi:nicotinate-nucleotide--dimethylbenzimidazole phosphoribosyltransferase